MPKPIDSENVIAWLNAQIEKVQGGWLHDYGFPTNVIVALTDVKLFVKNLPTIKPEMIDKYAAYKALKHEADTHMLPESKEAYERSARIIDQMKPDELPHFEERTCDNCGSGDIFKYMHENKPSAPDNAAGEFLLYLLEQIPLDTLIAYVIKRKEMEDAGSKTD